MESTWTVVIRFLFGLFLWFVESAVIITAIIFIVMCALLAMGKL